MLSGRPTYGCKGNKNDRPIYKNSNTNNIIKIINDNPIYYKQYDLFTYNYVNTIDNVNELIFLIRDPYEVFLRDMDNTTHYNYIIKSYIDNIKNYDLFRGNKLLLYYEDILQNKKDAILQIYDFLKINNKNKLKNTLNNIKNIYNESLNISIKTGGGISKNNITKYYEKYKNTERIKNVEKNIVGYIKKYPKYLNRYLKNKKKNI